MLRDDLLAGLTVALVGLPQSLAYAIMAGLPPAYGLSTAVVPGVVAALTSRSPQVITGPTNTTGLLILAALAAHLGPNGFLTDSGLPLLATLTLLAGMIRVVAAWAGGAMVVRFLPESVLVGFTAGAGILIVVMQLDEALGLPPVRASDFVDQIGGVAGLVAAGSAAAPLALVVTGATVAVLVLGRRYLPRWPAALVAVAVGALVAWLGDLDAADGLPLVLDRSGVPSGWPQTALPALGLGVARDLFVPASAIALLGTLELTVSARAGSTRPDMQREILSQGWANVVGAFAGAFPASASLTRSALLRLGNAQTRVAAFTGAACMAPVLLFAAPAVGFVPQASLAGVLFVTAYGMVDLRQLVRLWRAGAQTRLLGMATLAATLVLPLAWAILLGAVLGLVIHLAHTSTPRLRLLVPDGRRLLALAPREAPRIVVLEISGSLHYAAVQAFLEEAEAILPPAVKAVVVDLSHAHESRFAALRAFEALAEILARRGTRLYLAGVEPALAGFLERTRCALPFVPATAEPGESVRACVELAAAETPADAPPG